MNEFVRHPRTIRKTQLASAALGERRELTVYLPPGYNEMLSYPVLYCQDGEDFFLFGMIATIAGHLILEENIEPFIVVGVHVDKRVRTDEYAPDGERFAAYTRFFAEELVPFVERTYAARPGAENRIVAGDSLGGTVSLHLALLYPELFGGVIALSGAFFGSSREAVLAAGDLSHLGMFMLVGTDETAVDTQWGVIDFLRENRETKQLLERQKARLLYQEKPGRHLWGFWQKQLPDAIRHFLA